MTKKNESAIESAVYAHSVPVNGSPMGPAFTVRIVVEPSADRAFTADELAHVLRVLTSAGIDAGALLDGSLRPAPRAARSPKRSEGSKPARPASKAPKRAAAKRRASSKPTR